MLEFTFASGTHQRLFEGRRVSLEIKSFCNRPCWLLLFLFLSPREFGLFDFVDCFLKFGLICICRKLIISACGKGGEWHFDARGTGKDLLVQGIGISACAFISACVMGGEWHFALASGHMPFCEEWQLACWTFRWTGNPFCENNTISACLCISACTIGGEKDGLGRRNEGASIFPRLSFLFIAPVVNSNGPCGGGE